MAEDDWTHPRAEEVANDVFRLPLPLPNDGLRAVNVYALVSSEGVTLIDGGWDTLESSTALIARLAEVGASPHDVTDIHVTHFHRDHYTQAIALRRTVGATVALGAGEAENLEILRDVSMVRFAPQLEHLMRLGAFKTVAAVRRDFTASRSDTAAKAWEDPDRWLRCNEVIRREGHVLEVVATPGHTRGHIVFHDQRNARLFAGDHVLPHITPSIGFEQSLQPSPLGAFLDSLARVRARPDAQLLPAHGPVRASVHERIDELVAHHDERLRTIEEGLRAGHTDAEAVAASLRWTRHGYRLDELDSFNRMLAVLETSAHLDLLVAQDRALAAGDQDKLRYVIR